MSEIFRNDTTTCDACVAIFSQFWVHSCPDKHVLENFKTLLKIYCLRYNSTKNICDIRNRYLQDHIQFTCLWGVERIQKWQKLRRYANIRANTLAIKNYLDEQKRTEK